MDINFNNIIIKDESEIYDNHWIEYKTELIEDDKYNVYQGIGDYSPIKLLIKEELKLEAQSI